MFQAKSIYEFFTSLLTVKMQKKQDSSYCKHA